MVNVVRPTGDMTPARPDAAVRGGNQLQGLFCSYGERVEWRIQRWRWRRLGWPELPAASSFAAAGARARSGLAFGGTGGEASGGYGLLETC